jgi:predicted regulator of Ras-like GTPase activity (Roadblock/LC7/MglB family)
LDKVLSDLRTKAPEIEAAAIVSFDGLPMVSDLPAGMDEDRVAAMCAALLSLGERASVDLGRGLLNQVYIEGETGTVFLIACDEEAVLVAVAAAGSKVGMMLYEVRRGAQAIAEVLAADVAIPEQQIPAQQVPAGSPGGSPGPGLRSASSRVRAATGSRVRRPRLRSARHRVHPRARRGARAADVRSRRSRPRRGRHRVDERVVVVRAVERPHPLVLTPHPNQQLRTPS